MKTPRFLLSIMDWNSQTSRAGKSTAVRPTSFSPHLNNKTTSVEGRLSCAINLINLGRNEVLDLMPTKKSTTFSFATKINVMFLPVHYRVNGITTRYLPTACLCGSLCLLCATPCNNRSAKGMHL